MPLSFAERFRTWYEYERDANAKALKMLESVPAANRASPQFARAVAKMAHIVAARHMWLFRLGKSPDRPQTWEPDTPLEKLPAYNAEIESRWVAYFATLTDADLEKDFEFKALDGKGRRWRVIDLLTQVFGHPWYHRGQIAMLVKELGGETVDTDFIFWARPTVLE